LKTNLSTLYSKLEGISLCFVEEFKIFVLGGGIWMENIAEIVTDEQVPTTDNEVEYYNPILGTAGPEARQSFFEELWRLDNVVVLLGAGFSKAIGGPLMADLSRKILPDVIMSGYTPNPGKDRMERWERVWEIDTA
jgi:hypothetical protein